MSAAFMVDVQWAWQELGPEGRKLFEHFLRKVNKLGAEQQLEAQARRDAERSRELPGSPPAVGLPMSP